MVTPAVYSGGWLPGWLDEGLTGTLPGTGIRVRLVSACIPRRQSFSGWDYKERQPKAASYAVPAGSVYLFEVTSGDVTADGLKRLFLEPLCDEERFNNDGFGLALPGVWEYAG